MSVKKIAVVGAGLIGARHAEIVSRLPECELCAIVDPAASAKTVAHRLDVPLFRSLEELFKAREPDGAIIASPNKLHAEQGRICVTAGIPVLVEKPIDADAEAARAFLDAADAANVPVLVGHHRRHNPLIKAAKKRLEGGAIGEIVAANALCWLYKPDDYFDVPWRTEPGAGPVFINLIHDIDLLRHLVGEITAVQAFHSNFIRGHAVEDTAAITLQFDNGALGTVSVSDTLVSPWSWELTAAENPAYPETGQSCYQIGGTKGALEIPTGRSWHQDEPRSWWAPINSSSNSVKAANPLDEQIRHFCRVIDGVEMPLVSGEEGLRTLIAVEAIKRSAETGMLVRL